MLCIALAVAFFRGQQFQAAEMFAQGIAVVLAQTPAGALVDSLKQKEAP